VQEAREAKRSGHGLRSKLAASLDLPTSALAELVEALPFLWVVRRALSKEVQAFDKLRLGGALGETAIGRHEKGRPRGAALPVNPLPAGYGR